MKIKYCLVTASKPNCVTKIYRLDGSELSKETSANVYEGQLQIRDVESAGQFAQRLQELSHAQCHTYGVPPNDASLITEKNGLNWVVLVFDFLAHSKCSVGLTAQESCCLIWIHQRMVRQAFHESSYLSFCWKPALS